MKKPAPAASPAPRTFWRPLAWASLVVNLALATWLWSVATKAPPPAPEKPVPAAPAAPPPVAVRSRELAPYAALGSYLAENNRIADLGWSREQFAAFVDGVRANYEGRGLPLDDTAKKLRDEISHRVQSLLTVEQPNPVDEYFRSLREKEGVSRTPSGLHYRITEAGTGPMPKAGDSVVLSFSTTLPDGQALPAFSQARVKAVVQNLLPGLAEGVQLLHVGGKALIYVPPALAFPDGKPPAQVPPGIPLVIFVELHDVLSAP